MKKGKRRLLTGMLCLALLFADIVPTGLTVQASELKQEESAINEDSAGAVEDFEDLEQADAGKEDTDVIEGTETGGSGEESDQEDSDSLEGTETGGSEGESGAEDTDTKEDTETENPDESGQTETEVSEEEPGEADQEEKQPESVSENNMDEALIQEAAEIMSTPQEGKINNVTWRIDSYNWLILEGEGDYISESDEALPWAKFRFGGARVNIKGLTSMRGMFAGCADMQEVDLSKQDMSHVTDMSYMFSGCKALRLHLWDQGGWGIWIRAM